MLDVNLVITKFHQLLFQTHYNKASLGTHIFYMMVYYVHLSDHYSPNKKASQHATNFSVVCCLLLFKILRV